MAIKRTRPFRKPPKRRQERKNTSEKIGIPVMNQFIPSGNFESFKGNYIKNRDDVRFLNEREIQAYCPELRCNDGQSIINCPGDNQTCCCGDDNPNSQEREAGCLQPDGTYGITDHPLATGICPPNYIPQMGKFYAMNNRSRVVPGETGYDVLGCMCVPTSPQSGNSRGRY